MPVSDLLILALAAWRLSRLLAFEDGPAQMLARLRYAVGVRYDAHSQAYAVTEAAKLVLCYYCSSVWIGAGFTLIYLFLPVPALVLALPFALSGATIICESVIQNLNN